MSNSLRSTAYFAADAAGQSIRPLDNPGSAPGTVERGRVGRLAEYQFGRGMQRVHEQPARRRIRAELLRVCCIQGVHRTQRNGVGTAQPGHPREFRCPRKVADTDVARVVQPVKLRRQTPQPRVGNHVLDRAAARRRHRQHNLTVFDTQPVIADLGDGRDAQTAAGGQQGDLSRLAAFQQQFGRLRFVAADIQARRAAGHRRHQGREIGQAAAFAELPAAGGQFAAGIGGKTQGRQHAAQNRSGDNVRPACIVLPFDRDPCPAGQVAKDFVAHATLSR